MSYVNDNKIKSNNNLSTVMAMSRGIISKIAKSFWHIK